jgi:kynurenine formamidase
MESVHQSVRRRDLLRLAGTAAVAAVGSHMLGMGEALAAPMKGGLSRIQDLTHTLKPTFPTYADMFTFKSAVAVTVKKDGFYAMNLTYFEHVGTHMDAPAHFGADAKTVEQVAASSLVAPLAVIYIHERAAKSHDAQVTIDDIRAWERRHGRLPRGAAVFMHSGWESRVGSTKTYRNPDSGGTMHFPGVHPDAAAFLLKERDVAGIGVDTLSLDIGPSKDFKTHTTWLPANKWGLENVANLTRVPPSGATVFVGAPKVAGGSGGPARVIAMW